MKKLIELNDDVTDFALDEVDCFQRPISIALGSVDKQYSAIFLLYAKTLELYTSNTLREIRYDLIDILKHMGFFVEPFVKGNLLDFIYKKINNNNLIIMGIDYNKLFYSKYYKVSSYPHWFIVNGYDSNSKVISIMDYTQFMDKRFKFEPFALSDKILKNANKKFKVMYGEYYNCFSIEVIDINKSLTEDIKKLLDYIIQVMEKKEFSIVALFNRLIVLMKLPDVSQDDIKNAESQILNVNKGRKVFFSEIINLMDKFNFDIKSTDKFSEKSCKLITEYNNFSNYCLLRILSDQYDNVKFKDMIRGLESEILELIKDFRHYISLFSEKIQVISEKKNEKILNDLDNVIHLEGKDVFFDFIKNREYNWWENDNAPKLKVLEINGMLAFEISAQIEISNESDCHNFQAGFYIINGEESYFAGVDVSDKICLDKINIDNYSCYYEYIPVQKIYIVISSNFLEVGKLNGKIKKCILKRYFERKNMITVRKYITVTMKTERTKWESWV